MLDEARVLLMRLSLDGETSVEAREVYLRIEAARLEVQALRLSRSVRQRLEPGPKWTESSPWQPNECSLG
jgi:hypothetical protein